MSEITIYHNPRCSKSRQALNLLESRGISPRQIRYLEEPLDDKTLKSLLKKLGMSARDLLRDNEEIYRELGLQDPSVGDEKIIAAMIKFPRLIQRPIVVKGTKAVLGRPPENVLELL